MRNLIFATTVVAPLLFPLACGGRIEQGDEKLSPAASSAPTATSTPTGSSTPPPAPTTCAWDSPFATIKAVAGIDGASTGTSFTQNASPRLTADELSIFFRHVVYDSSGDSSDWSIMTASRAKRTDPFGPAKAIDKLGAKPSAPWVSADGLTLFWNSDLAPGKISVASQPTAASFFGDVTLKVVAISPAPSSAGYPCVSADGSELWFETDAAVGSGKNYLISHAHSDGQGGFTDAAPEDELNFAPTNVSPVLSADGLTIYTGQWGYTSNGVIKDMKSTDLDIFVAHRTSKSAAFSTPVALSQINTSFTELPGWISPDNCRFYFSESTTDHPDDAIFVAERLPR